jgi:hypothetical protein
LARPADAYDHLREQRIMKRACAPRNITAAAGLVLCAMAGHAQGTAFVPADIEVCPVSADVRDPEFDIRSGQVVFHDRNMRLKVAAVRIDGTIPSACRGTLVDTGLTTSMPGLSARNGAEWARSQAGAELYYTKLDGAGQPALARAWKTDVWRTEFLANGAQRAFPIPSVNAADAGPRILYVRQEPTATFALLWRDVARPLDELTIPWSVTQGTLGAPRWIAGQRAVTTVVQDPSGVFQAARYFVDSSTTELLTTDAGQKDEVWMWSAPEFGGALVFSTLVDGCCLRIYRQAGAAWILVNTITMTSFSAQPKVFSPQPFVYKRRSYLSMAMSTDRTSRVSEIWIAAIDPAAPLVRRVDDPALANQDRREPEPYTNAAGAYVYYTQTSSSGYTLRRAATGL